MVFLNRFHRSIIAILLICFLCVMMGSVDIIRSQVIGTKNNTNRTLLLGFAICLLIILFVGKSFRWINTLNEKGCYLFSLIVFLLMMGVMITVSFSARVMQFIDSFDVMDTAFFLRKNAEVTDDLPYIKYVGSFGNNYPVILFQSFLLKIIQRLGIQNSEVFLTHLNVLVILSAVFFTWMTVRKAWGLKFAAKTAVVILLNPYFYLMVNWTYSMTYSLPIMMGILYVALCLKKTNTRQKGVMLALLEGLLLGMGFLIRPTTLFPLIAFILVSIPSFIKHRLNHEKIIRIICVLLTMVLVFTFVNIHVNKRFGSIRQLSMPLSFWLLMGSHGNGIWNEKDLDAMLAIHDTSEKTEYARDQTMKNYAALGIDGILDHWFRKITTAWADGGFFYKSPPASEGNSLSEYILGNGARNQLTKIYCQAFRLMMIIVFLLACAFALIKRNVPEIVLIMVITIFGCVAFHSIWETNVRYSIPFILPMLVVIVYGISTAQDFTTNRVAPSKIQVRKMGIILLGFLLIVCSSLNIALKEETTLNFYRVSSTANTRVCDEIKPQDFLQLDQDFYSDKPFNTLLLKAALPFQTNKEECSAYNLSILDDNEQIIFSTLLTPELINGQGITVPLDSISGYKHYHIRLEKEEPGKQSIRFYTHYTYGVDDYRGILKIDGGAAYPNDLMMDVYETQRTTVFSDKMRIIVVVFIMLLGAFISFAPIRKKNKALCA